MADAYFTAAEFKDRYPDDAAVQAKDDAVIDAARVTAEEIIEGLDAEEGCHQAFVVRTEAFELPGGRRSLSIPRYRVRSIESVTIDEEEQDIESLFLDNSSIFGRWWPRTTLVVTVTHGWDAPPGRIKDAAIILTYNRVITGPIDDRATGRLTPEGSVITLATPGIRGAVTGIPEVDAAIQQYQKPLIRPLSIPLTTGGDDRELSGPSGWRDGVW